MLVILSRILVTLGFREQPGALDKARWPTPVRPARWSRCSAAGSSVACSGSPASRSASRSASSTRRRTRRPRAVGELVVGALDDETRAHGGRTRRRPSSPTSGKACPPTRRAFLAADARRSARARARSRSRRTGSPRRRRSARSASATPAFARGRRPRRSRRRGRRGRRLPAVLKTRRGGYDGKGQAVLRDRADVDARVGRARRRAADPRGVRAVRPRALGPRGARRSTATVACWPLVENQPRGRHPAREPRAGARRRRRAAGARRGSSRRACSTTSTTSACSRSSCSTSAASCSPTRSRRACTTPATGRSRARRPASSRTTCARSSGWPLGSTAARGASAMVNCIGDDARPRRGARGPRRAPARLRQGAAPRPQGRPRHRHRAPTTTSSTPRLALRARSAPARRADAADRARRRAAWRSRRR